MTKFDTRKYQNENNTLVDGSDSLANNRDLVISFYHVPSGRSVLFKAFITAFNESYNSNFTPHEAFGRTDPIYQYKNTTRKITLAFKVPAASESEAFDNLGRISAVERMLYPSYKQMNSATTLNQAPLIRIKVMNLLTGKGFNNTPLDGDTTIDLLAGTAGNPRNVLYNSYKSTSDPSAGLLGVIDNFNVNHNLEGDDGVFYKREEIVDPQTGRKIAKGVPNTILPKLIDVNLAFSPIHENTIGWDDSGHPTNSFFPYGVYDENAEPEQLEFFQNQQTLYNAKVRKQDAINNLRNLRQQEQENAKARYTKANGELRMGRRSRDFTSNNRRRNASYYAYESIGEDAKRQQDLEDSVGGPIEFIGGGVTYE